MDSIVHGVTKSQTQLSLSYKLQFHVIVLNYSFGLAFSYILIKCYLFSLINLF